MKLMILNDKITRGLTFTGFIKAFTVFIMGILLTWMLVHFIDKEAQKDFEKSCEDMRVSIDNRLKQHAQLLRGGKALFEVSDTVTPGEWHEYFIKTKMESYLPGIQGFGFAKLIYPGELEVHEATFRKIPGYHGYQVWYNDNGERREYSSSGKKAEFYTSIVYLEPLDTIPGSQGWRNMRAIGYDMFSEPIRREAMEKALLSGNAILSGRVTLVQETDKEVQPGVLMYIPVYRKTITDSSTITERRREVMGWVYSPYRMKDLMSGIRDISDQPKRENDTVTRNIQIEIFDEQIADDRLLYDNRNEITFNRDNLLSVYTTDVEFNGRRWVLRFTPNKKVSPTNQRNRFIVITAGAIISVLLFILIIMFINANTRRREIEILNRQLEKLNRDKDRFIAILSHDLKSPFTAILGFLDLLKENLRAMTIDQIEHHVKIVDQSSRYTFNLLEDLLTWTRAHSGKIPFSPEILEFRSIFLEVIGGIRPVADVKGIRIEFVKGDAVRLYADRDMLKIILRNLVSNSVKFTPAGGIVRVWAEQKENFVEVVVSDNGVGMTTEHQKKLFDMTNFFSTTGTANEKGSGIGLIICYELVEQHGGVIRVESEQGKGSTFTFKLPEKSKY